MKMQDMLAMAKFLVTIIYGVLLVL